MKNPVVIFVGAALITLAALVGVSSSRWQNWSKPSEILAEAPKPTPEQGSKVAVQEPPKSSKAPATESETAKKPEESSATQQKTAESSQPPEKNQQQAAVDPSAPADQSAQQTPAPSDEPVKRGEKGGTFDVVRIDANGESVFAGRCDPGATVALLMNGKVIGSAKANADGEWLIVPEAPFPPGNHEITIESTNPNGRKWLSQQQLAVSIEPEKKPLIVLSEANQPSRVLQKPDEQVAVAPEAPAQPEPKAEQPPAAADQKEAPKVETQDAPETAAGEKQAEPSADAETPKAEERQTAEAAPEPEAPSTAAPKVEAPKADESAKQSTDQPAAKDDKVATADPQAAGEQAAETKTPPPAAEEPRTAESGLSLDTVDYNDKGDIIFSGKAESGAAVRLYVDNRHVGDAIADDRGSWSFAGREQIKPGAHSLRADVVDNAGKVSQRIELPFMRADPNQVAALQDERKQEPQTAAEAPKAETPTVPEPEISTSDVQVETPTAEAPAKEEPRADEQQTAAAEQPQAGTRATPEVDVSQPEEQAAETPAREQPEEQAAAPAAKQATEEPAAKSDEKTTTQPDQPQQPQSEPAEQPEKPQTTQEAGQQPAESLETPKIEAQTDTSTKQDQQAAVTSDEPAQAAEAEPRKGRVVIQPGNNLWRISRVIYGRGVEYTTIYDANKDQIRNPHLIYPGQIFTTPNVVPPEAIDPKRRLPMTAEELNVNR